MIPKECKRLAEVDFPIAKVSAHSAREKSIRHGHPSTLHLWWARRPLAACRSMLMALLLPDPCDPHCPPAFKDAARRILLDFPGRPARWEWEFAGRPDPNRDRKGTAGARDGIPAEVGARRDSRTSEQRADAALRHALLHEFIADFANWDNAANPAYLKAARALVKAAHLPAGGQAAYEPPLVVDPFAGGGSIPLEALRIGCDAFASDLNPVACLINKVLLEDIPRHGPKLAEELRRVGAEIKKQAEQELAEFYPCLPAGRPPTPPKPGKFYVYVLECADGTHYKGQTDDVPRRLKEHEAGRVEYTAARLPVILVHEEELDSREAAVEREKYLKSGSGREWLKAKIDATRERPIAYLWARTVRCEQPNCGCEIPLIKSFWLSKNASRRRALRYMIKRTKGAAPCLQLEVFTPTAEKDIPGGTVNRAKATCPACNRVMSPDRVRAQLREQRGGADVELDPAGRRIGGATLLAVVLSRAGETGRDYRAVAKHDHQAILSARRQLDSLQEARRRAHRGGLSPIPSEPTPSGGGSGAGRAFSVQTYGMFKWADLFTSRQLLTLTALSDAIQRYPTHAAERSLRHVMALAMTRVADYSSSLCSWHVPKQLVRNTFSRQVLPIVWDFCETVPLSNGPGNFDGALDWITRVIEAVPRSESSGQAHVADAREPSLPDDAASIWFTDPPYYDAVPYADLSDFFMVWFKRILHDEPDMRDPFDATNDLTPKTREIVQDEVKQFDGRPKDRRYFEESMSTAFAAARGVLADEGIGSVVFAHKTTEGWEALLSGIIRGGWVITGSWPITTEMGTRLRARESAALSASVHLVCRPRDDDAGIGDWGEIIRELPRRIGDWMERLSGEGIRGADLVFACIGPALELFSKYARVETPDGEEVGLAANDQTRSEPARRGFLSYVWEFAGRTALNQVLGTAEARARNGAAGALPAGQAGLEEDARLTALFLWTLQATEAGANGKDQSPKRKRGAETDEDDDLTGEDAHPTPDDDEDEDAGATKGKKKAGLTLIYDVARRFAQPLGIHLDVWEGRIIETSKGIVRLLPVRDRAKQLFGEEGASAVARKFDTAKKPSPQMMLDFMAEQRAAVPEIRGRGRRGASASGRSKGAAAAGKPGEAMFGLTGETPVPPKREATTLDRVHAAMLLQSSGASNALRALLEAEVDRGPDFLRLANALSALYPRDSEEKRLLDAMLLAVPR